MKVTVARVSLPVPFHGILHLAPLLFTQPTSWQLPLSDRKADNMASKLGSSLQVEAVTTR